LVSLKVLGEHAGWLALQTGIAVCADAVLIPEIPYDINAVASKLRKKFQAGSTSAFVWWPKAPRPGTEAKLRPARSRRIHTKLLVAGGTGHCQRARH